MMHRRARMAEENGEERLLSDRARALLAASRQEDLGVSFRPGGPSMPADKAEEELIKTSGRELSFAALESIAAGIQEIEKALERWVRPRALDDSGRAEAGRYWHSQLAFITQGLLVDDAAYLRALAAAASAPSIEGAEAAIVAEGAGSACGSQEGARSRAATRSARMSGWLSKVEDCDADISRRKLDAAGARQAPTALADAVLRAEGALGADALMPPPVREEMLPDRAKLLAGMLAGAPAWLWRKTSAGEPSPIPVTPPEWMSAPAHAAFAFRAAASKAASAAIDDNADCDWAKGCKAWAEDAQRAWERGTYDAQAAWLAAPAADGRAAEEEVDPIAAGAIRASGAEALSECLAATLACQAAAKIPGKTRARAPDAQPAPLTVERMSALLGANPIKPYF